MSTTDQNQAIDSPKDALKADPDGLVSELESYSRSKVVVHPDEWKDQWDGKRGGKVKMITESPISIDVIMKDLHSSMNTPQYGYFVTKVHEIMEPFPDKEPEECPPLNEIEEVYRITFEPIAKYLAFAANGHYCRSVHEFIDGAPTRG